MGTITLIDWGIWIVYFTFLFLLVYFYRNSKNEIHYKYFIRGFLIKVFGGVVFALIYVYYYKFGDTFLYHRGATVLSQTLIDSPGDYFRLLFSENGNLPNDLSQFAESIHYSRTYEEWFMVKLLSPINLISFQSYLVSTLFMSTIAFIGSWKLFLVFRDILPSKSKLAFYAVFLVPSVVFWGGGIMKDTFTLFSINFIIYALYFSVFKKNFKPVLLLSSLILIYVVIQLKAYIVLAFLPGLFLGIYSFLKSSIQNSIIRFIAGPAIFVSLITVSYFGLSGISEGSTKYSTSNLEYQVKGFHSWHTDVGGSSYNLGEVEYSATGVITKVPAALNVTYFRPYIWEAGGNPVLLIGALESLILLFLFLLVLYKLGRKFFRVLKTSPLLYGLFIYCLIFGFAVGFTSYNFGALARYKIPVMSLFVFILLYLREKSMTMSPDKTE